MGVDDVVGVYAGGRGEERRAACRWVSKVGGGRLTMGKTR